MSNTVSLREFFDEKFAEHSGRLEGLDKKADAILIEVRATNGRVRKAEVAIAILQWAYAIGAAVLAGWFFDILKRP